MGTYKDNVIGVLQIISSKSEQIDLFERFADSDRRRNVPDVLLERWESAYRPDLAEFNSQFSETELRQMNCFTDFFLSRIGNLPTECRELLRDPYWDKVCKYAWEILQDFSGELDRVEFGS